MRLAYFIILVFFCGGLNAQSVSTPEAKVITGIASYYHDKFHGRTMANGRKFSQDKYIAASNRFPLNRWVKVTNLSNGQSVNVKITDRMAKNNKRIIDLSYAAAEDLKMVKQGLKRVQVELLINYTP